MTVTDLEIDGDPWLFLNNNTATPVHDCHILSCGPLIRGKV